MSAPRHSVPVVDAVGLALTPTTPARARKLMQGEQAVPFFDKFGRYCLRLCVQTRKETPITTLGIDPGAKYDGYAVVCGTENVLAVKLDLPHKETIVRRMLERRNLRHARRVRHRRRRPARLNNRKPSPGWIAPSQNVIVCSRLKVLRALFATYPITLVGLEDVAFNHAKQRWGTHFSTAEIGKAKLRAWIEDRNANVTRYRGHETKALREGYGYKKTSSKHVDRFDAHCSDALALAVAVGHEDGPIVPGLFLVMDDTYRAVRRRLHDTQPTKGGVRTPYSKGTVRGLRKGLLIGTTTGRCGRLCGERRGRYRYYDAQGTRQAAQALAWISSQYVMKKGESQFSVA